MLGNLFSGNEQRAISFQSIWGAGDTFAYTTDSGANIDESTSMTISAFYACVLLISDTISTLPVDSFIRRDGSRVPYRPKPEWVIKPDIDLLRSEHYQQVLVSLLLDGNSFTRIFRDGRGDVANLVCLDPLRVQIQRNAVTREIEYLIDNGSAGVVPARDMLHITEIRKPGAMRGTSRVNELKENLGLASALQSFAARFFGQGATSQGIIEFPGALTREQAKDLQAGFDNAHKGYRKAHKTGVLSAGAKYVKTGVNPDEAQMLDSQKFQVESIARMFRVPPHMIGVTTPGAQSYASVEQNNIQFVVHTLRPYIEKIEYAYSTLLPTDAFLKFNVDGLLRGDFTTRIQGYSIGLQAGFYSVNDVRRFEDLRPVEAGDQFRVPLANINLAEADVVEQDKRVSMATRLVQTGFDPASVLSALGLPAITHTGVPSTQLQPVAQIDAQDPSAVYDVSRSSEINIQIPETVVNIPQTKINVEPPIVNINAPEQKPLIRTVERDENNHIVRIIETNGE
ncbi:COG4695 Phage-related protein [uncultured Caudovirales phage]|uniref:COG4695 Phage-related protein n=1 Tax=uncultured Caudovirales phage TaxID=2100421 RepID=A0A6J5NF28_9CAUD|nr:COG4695 Phage-related protein [uncultured Caudovirales phage]